MKPKNIKHHHMIIKLFFLSDFRRKSLKITIWQQSKISSK